MYKRGLVRAADGAARGEQPGGAAGARGGARRGAAAGGARPGVHRRRTPCCQTSCELKHYMFCLALRCMLSHCMTQRRALSFYD